jgi:hypothetical protein
MPFFLIILIPPFWSCGILLLLCLFYTLFSLRFVITPYPSSNEPWRWSIAFILGGRGLFDNDAVHMETSLHFMT